MREVKDPAGNRWTAEIASHGRTSGYLNPKVHRPIVQFTCLDRRVPKKYSALPVGRDSLDGLSEADLTALLENAEVH